MSQLTQQIAGAYIGAPIKWRGNRTAKVIDVIDTDYLPDCRLILTPLSHITGEDAVEVGKLANVARYQVREFIGSHKDDFFMIGRYLVYEFNANTYIELRIHTDRYIAIIDYLRSRNYDLGYMGIKSLIDAGIAISSLDKTETK